MELCTDFWYKINHKTMDKNTIKIRDFTEYPGLRHCTISDHSGEEYYHEILNEAFKDAFENKHKLCVDLDDTAGYPPSFLDEAFGNLVFDFGLENVRKHIKIRSTQEPNLKEEIKDTFTKWQKRKEKKDKPKKTGNYQNVFRLIDGRIKLVKV